MLSGNLATNWKNASSSITVNPSRPQQARITSIRSFDRIPATTATAPAGASRGSIPNSKAGWPAWSLSWPARINAASSASVWADPRCSTITRWPCLVSTICTAVTRPGLHFPQVRAQNPNSNRPLATEKHQPRAPDKHKQSQSPPTCGSQAGDWLEGTRSAEVRSD